MQIIQFDAKYTKAMHVMVLQAKEAIGKTPKINSDLVDVQSSYIANGDMFWLAIDDSDNVIGCLGYNRLNSTQAKLHRFYVKADMKRQGIGSALLAECEKHLAELCFKEVLAHTGDLSAVSSGFYEKNGYVEYQPGWMKKALL